MLIINGMVIDVVGTRAEGAPAPLLAEPHLIVSVHRGSDKLVVIPVSAQRSAGRVYFRGVRRLSLQEVEKQLDLNHPVLTLKQFSPRAATLRSEDELQAMKGRDRAVQRLNAKWGLVQFILRPTVGGEGGHTADENDSGVGSPALLDCLFDPEQRPAILLDRSRAILKSKDLCEKLRLAQNKKKHASSESTEKEPSASAVVRLAKHLQHLLNQFWAGGSTKGALIGFADNCGARGKSRRAGEAKRGRPNQLVLATNSQERAGINIVEDGNHHKIIAFCYGCWVFRGTGVEDALRRMWDDFYSKATQRADGTVVREWIPAHERPTVGQFRDWGTRKDRTRSAWRVMLAPKEFEKNYRAVLGSVNDDIFGIGQRGSLDTSPTDVELVKALDRTQRIGTANRILVVESVFGLIAGLYQGLEAASSRTVRLAAFNAADPDKQGWLQDLSLEEEIPADDFIPIMFASLIGDNTDMRAEDVMQCLGGIGTDIHYVPKMRADLNAPAEVGHHVLHRLSDHRLPGTTHGRKRERGEERAEVFARLSNIEALRASVRAIHVHNTMLLEDFRTLDMRFKGVRPTRLELTKALIQEGRIARAAWAADRLRRQLLPSHWGTFTEKGVRLHSRNERSKPKFIGHIRYVSAHPIIVRWCEEARRGGRHEPDFFRQQFIVDPFRPRRIWFIDPPTGESVELELKVIKMADIDLPYVLTLSDMIHRDEIEGVEEMDAAETRHQARAALARSQRQMAADADLAYQAAVAARGSEPTKAEMRANKRKNRDDERDEAIYGMSIPEHVLARPDDEADALRNCQDGQASAPASVNVDSAPSAEAQPPVDDECMKAAGRPSLLSQISRAEINN